MVLLGNLVAGGLELLLKDWLDGVNSGLGSNENSMVLVIRLGLLGLWGVESGNFHHTHGVLETSGILLNDIVGLEFHSGFSSECSDLLEAGFDIHALKDWWELKFDKLIFSLSTWLARKTLSFEEEIDIIKNIKVIFFLWR